MMRFSRIAVAALVALIALPAMAQLTLDRPVVEPQPYHIDTGALSNSGRAALAMHEEIVHIGGAAWLRVYFGDVELGPGSYLTITSDFDGEVQTLDAEALAMWSDSTAYFNGETLRIELIAAPQTVNRLVIDQVAWEMQPEVPVGGCGICGADDRVESFEEFAARLLPAGCSATVYNPFSCMVTAGHCISGGMVLQFNVPHSNANCNIVMPPISEQFPAQQFSFTNGGVGNDWGVLTVGTNNLGEKPFDRYGVYKPVASTPPSTGNSLTIWGYGVDSQCIFSQVQQTSNGAVTNVGGTSFNHNVDATFGNSGSSVMRDGEEILGIATHCPCPNWATRIDHPSFAAARETICPEVLPEAAPLLSANVIAGTLLSGGVAELSASDDSYFMVDSVTSGPRNNAVTEIAAQLPSATVSQLSVVVEYGASVVSPIFYLMQIYNDDSGSWENLRFGIASPSLDLTVDSDEIPNPNSYVSASGEVRVRVAETARVPQTPGGYTKRIDHVQVLFLE